MALSFMYGCFEDKSGVSEGQIEVITIEGIEDSYTVETREQTLEISPKVSSNKPAEWEFTWGYIVSNYEMVEIGSDKDLSYVFDLEPKVWELIFKAKNTKTGLEKFVMTKVSLITRFTRGWYVLKDDGSTSDFDLYPSVSGILPEGEDRRIADAVTHVNGEGMSGKGITFMVVHSFPMIDEQGTFNAVKSIVAIGENDFGVFNVENLERKRDRTNLAFDQWPVIEPTMCWTTSQSLYLCNAGKLYQIELNSKGITGRFRQPMQLGTGDSDYSLSPSNLPELAFDELTSSFVKIGPYQAMQYCRTSTGSTIPALNNDMTCIFMGGSVGNSVGLFQHRGTGERELIKIVVADPLVLSSISILGPNDKLNGASIIASATDVGVIYFAGADGKVYSRMLNAVGTEALEFDVPNGETVTFIKQITIIAETTRYLMAVATVKGSGANAVYTVRFFSKFGGHFDKEEEEIRLSGKGTARDVLFVKP